MNGITCVCECDSILQVDVLSDEVCRARSESGERVRVLETREREQAERLTAYQQIETEMDDVILQAAQG